MPPSVPAPDSTRARRLHAVANGAVLAAALGLTLAVALPFAFVPPAPLVPARFGHAGLYFTFPLVIASVVLARVARLDPAARRRARLAYVLAALDFSIASATWLWLLVALLRGSM